MNKTELPAALEHVFERKGHPYHMWDGILSIPTGLEDILYTRTRDEIRKASLAVLSNPPFHLLGCGTSYFAAYTIALAIQQIAGLPAYAWEAFEFLAYPPVDLKGSTVIGISHSGSTPPVVRALELARERSASTGAYTDGVSSALDRAGEWTILSTMGAEPALPKTRSFTATLMRGYLQALELGRLSQRDVIAWEAALVKSPNLADQVLAACEPQVRDLAKHWQAVSRVVVSGGGPHLTTAQEGMLKITEASRFNATCWEIEEAVHGTWASTVAGDLIIILAMDGPSYESAVRLAGGMKTIGCRVWVITNRSWSGVDVDALTSLPEGEPELIMPLYAIIPLYQFSYFAALAKGISPDNMRMDDPSYLDARMQMRSTVS